VDAYDETCELSVKERKVRMLLGEGLRDKQIAEKLVISQDTVTMHVSRISRKTSPAGKTDLL